MSVKLMKFLLTTTALLGASVALMPVPVGAVDPAPGASPLSVSATVLMGSGAPLGGIGTGFVELRPDGAFHEWEILNEGKWSHHTRRPSKADVQAATPPNLRFFLRTSQPGGGSPQLRRLCLNPDENDLYSLGYVQAIEGIDYQSWYPMTTLGYRDSTLPVRVSATAFSPFMPGKARESATPGFHFVVTLENTSKDKVEVSLLSLLDNPIVSRLADRKLTNTLEHRGDTTSLLLQSDAQPEDPSDLGSLCLSVTGGDHTWISGTFREYASPADLVAWGNPRVWCMRLNMLQDYFKTGRLPNTGAVSDPAQDFTLDNAGIDALPGDQLKAWIAKLRGDALFARVINDFQAGDPSGSDDSLKAILKEIRRNHDGGQDKKKALHPTWGTGALASTVTLEPGQTVEVRFTLSWFFPNHTAAAGSKIGHMYANWFQNAGEVNRFLNANYARHREATERFARCLLDTTLGTPMSFVWSSQLGTLVTSSVWSKGGLFGVWEGLGAAGFSTTDVDYYGSGSTLALFPELKLGQMKHILRFMTDKKVGGQIPHNYAFTFEKADPDVTRVDLNPQFVMMACRDYLWTGDKAYIAALYPSMVRAMAYTASLDTDGDGLPDKGTHNQSYDQWGMVGAPSCVSSLWIGALRAAIRMARDLGKPDDAARWQAILDKASVSFDKLLFNGDYYSLWVDGKTRNEICMADQISGEWFTHLMGYPTILSEQNVASAMATILKNNSSLEIGVGNASAPRGGKAVAEVANLQAAGVWSGVEFAFASFLMDHGRYAEGERIVQAVHRRYLRAGMAWNHVEYGWHYTRAMSSWSTLLAATGFKPDWPARTLTLMPSAPGDFRAPWVTASGFGVLARKDGALSLNCVSGEISFQKLRVNLPAVKPVARLAGRKLEASLRNDGEATLLEFANPVTLAVGQTLEVR